MLLVETEYMDIDKLAGKVSPVLKGTPLHTPSKKYTERSVQGWIHLKIEFLIFMSVVGCHLLGFIPWTPQNQIYYPSKYGC